MHQEATYRRCDLDQDYTDLDTDTGDHQWTYVTTLTDHWYWYTTTTAPTVWHSNTVFHIIRNVFTLIHYKTFSNNFHSIVINNTNSIKSFGKSLPNN